ncbi:phosphate acyltransferase [[Acholeplasma] multilocale]|uniref:phosphate acyltransferase n=1 Tax=[Acholeplasma] multilocale TaxID=264638 RepID=UPI00047C9A50|nr:phosphate acyltransferase [[Acholeplasma] multilocale]
MITLNEIIEKLGNKVVKQTVVFPEGDQIEIQKVANYLAKNKLARPILIIENPFKIIKPLDEEVRVIDIHNFATEEMKNQLFEIRKGKWDYPMVETLLKRPTYLAAMLVATNKADVLLGGLINTTADTIRPALQIIKTKPEFKLACSTTILQKNGKTVFFSDCGFNLNPNAEQLAEITKMTVDFAKSMGVWNPQVALLSYSTNGSGKGEDVTKIIEAVNLLKQDRVDFEFDGEMQFDAAWSKVVRDKKKPDSTITKEHPDIFIFPDINSGNIGYKIAQQMGEWEPIGPFILGLNKTVNDLSRGAKIDEIIRTALFTLYQDDRN